MDKYSKDQVTAYFDRIALPEQARKYDVSKLEPKASLEYLKLLMKHHLTQVPFENLALHYSHHRTITLHPSELYDKIIVRTRGGYCMELNLTFSTLLRSLGYTLYPVGARVNTSQDPKHTSYGPFDHMLNIVTLGPDRYLVDVGFGSNYVPIVPVRLINDSSGGGFENVSPARGRLVFKAIEGVVNARSKLWVYQHKMGHGENGAGDVWRDMYCFNADLEFRAADFEMMNYWTSTSGKTIFTQKVICNKMILDEDGEICGTVGLMRELKKRTGKESEVLQEFESEEERVKALEEHFGIVLSEVEREGIRRTVDEIVQ